MDACRTDRPLSRRLRVVLADDNETILAEIQGLLTPDFEIAGVARETGSLLDAVAELRPDIVVSDIDMNGSNGIEAGQAIVKSGLCEAVVILTMYNEAFLIERAFRAGIRGYVLKVDAGEELGVALRSVVSGKGYLSRGAIGREADGDAQNQDSPGG